jgi:hypothetical protein
VFIVLLKQLGLICVGDEIDENRGVGFVFWWRLNQIRAEAARFIHCKDSVLLNCVSEVQRSTYFIFSVSVYRGGEQVGGWYGYQSNEDKEGFVLSLIVYHSVLEQYIHNLKGNPDLVS